MDLRHILFAVSILLLLSCNKDDDNDNTNRKGIEVTKVKSSNADPNKIGLQLIMKDKETSNKTYFYGNYKATAEPKDLYGMSTVLNNNDTIRNYIFDTIGRVKYAFYSVKSGIKLPLLIKLNYINDTLINVLFFLRNWTTSQDSLIYNSIVKSKNGSNTVTGSYFRVFGTQGTSGIIGNFYDNIKSNLNQLANNLQSIVPVIQIAAGTGLAAAGGVLIAGAGAAAIPALAVGAGAATIVAGILVAISGVYELSQINLNAVSDSYQDNSNPYIPDSQIQDDPPAIEETTSTITTTTTVNYDAIYLYDAKVVPIIPANKGLRASLIIKKEYTSMISSFWFADQFNSDPIRTFQVDNSQITYLTNFFANPVSSDGTFNYYNNFDLGFNGIVSSGSIVKAQLYIPDVASSNWVSAIWP